MVISKGLIIEVKRLSAKTGYSVEHIKAMIKSPYEFITAWLKDLDLPRDLTEEEFNKAAKNFNIPAIGKLYSSYAVYKKINKLNGKKK